MQIVKKTGLVPVRSTTRGGRSGVFGVPPAVALAGLKSGEFALVPIPADIPVIDAAAPADEKPVEEPRDTTEPAEIPDDWEARGPLVWIATAKKILGTDIVLTDEQKQAGVKISDIAKATITEELQRRAAAEPSDE